MGWAEYEAAMENGDWESAMSHAILSRQEEGEMTTHLYPHDCSAECSERATWDITYTELYPREEKVMGACDMHKDDITRAATNSAILKSIKVTPHK